MEDKEIAEYVGSLSEKQLAELFEMQDRWLALPPLLRKYYNIKRDYFMKPARLVILVMIALIAAGLSAYFFELPLHVSVYLFLAGVIFGVALVWIVESR